MDPLGVSVEKDLTDVDEQAAEQEVGTGTFRAMKHLFDGDLGAFSYLLMVLLYIPCCASIGAMYREVGAGWTTFAAPMDDCYGLRNRDDRLSDRTLPASIRFILRSASACAWR